MFSGDQKGTLGRKGLNRQTVLPKLISTTSTNGFISFTCNCRQLILPVFSHILVFFISNYAQISALKVAYIFKVFGAQSCLMVAY